MHLTARALDDTHGAPPLSIADPVAEVFLDVTPLLDFAVRHRSVSGIQRVEARLLAELSKVPDASRVWCADVQPGGSQIVAWRLADVFGTPLQSDLEPFVRLATDTGCRGQQTWHDLRRRLNHRGVHGWRRTVAKTAFVASRAASFVRRGDSRRPSVPSVSLKSFPADSTVVLLGASWNTAQVGKVLRQSHSGPRVIHCVYDLIPLIHPEYFESSLIRSFTHHHQEVVSLCTDFLCISQCTHNDLRRSLAAWGAPRRSTVVRLPHEFHGYPRDATGCSPSNDQLVDVTSDARPYVLCVGTIEIRKNGIALLRAWSRLRQLMGESTPRLVMCGRRGWKVDSLYEMLEQDPWLRAHVTMVPSADDADLAHLYEHALFTVYPSLYEGWGLPVGESAWFGKHCIASRSSSIPEVCGDLIEYFDPHDDEEIARKVHYAAADPSYLALREARIREAPLRTWRQYAAEFLAALSGGLPFGEPAPPPAERHPARTCPH